MSVKSTTSPNNINKGAYFLITKLIFSNRYIESKELVFIAVLFGEVWLVFELVLFFIRETPFD
jgi:hypothetical protein